MYLLEHDLDKGSNLHGLTLSLEVIFPKSDKITHAIHSKPVFIALPTLQQGRVKILNENKAYTFMLFLFPFLTFFAYHILFLFLVIVLEY